MVNAQRVSHCGVFCSPEMDRGGVFKMIRKEILAYQTQKGSEHWSNYFISQLRNEAQQTVLSKVIFLFLLRF